jgi:hypothetical protein
MTNIQNPEILLRYLYSLSISNYNYVLEKDIMICDYYSKGNLNNIEIIKDLIFEITNYDNNMLIHLNYFVNTLKLDEIVKNDLYNIIFTSELNRFIIFDIYSTYVEYLDILPIG